MTLDSLVLSKDPEVVRVIRPTLEKLSIEVEICHEAKAGANILISDKFDAVIGVVLVAGAAWFVWSHWHNRISGQASAVGRQ